MEDAVKECLDWMIANKFENGYIQIVYADNGDYLYDEDMEIIKSGNYEIVEKVKIPDTVDEELCFRIIFKNVMQRKNDDDYIEGEVYCYSEDWDKEWIRWNRNLILDKLFAN